MRLTLALRARGGSIAERWITSPAEVVAQTGGEWPADETATRVYTYFFITRLCP